MAGNIKGELGSIPSYATLTHQAPSAFSHQPKFQSNELINLYKYVQWIMLVMKGGIMKRHHMGPIQKHPDRRSCLILTANASVQLADRLSDFSCWAS